MNSHNRNSGYSYSRNRATGDSSSTGRRLMTGGNIHEEKYDKEKLPEKWLDLLQAQECIECFLPVKSPISDEVWEAIKDEEARERAENKFRLEEFIALAKENSVGLVIDLSAPKLPRYSVARLKMSGLEHVRLNHGNVRITQISLQDILSGRLDQFVNRFIEQVDKFRKESPEMKIAVHCTHGRNRTGYLICRYLMKEFNLTAVEAIEKFEHNRGVKMDKPFYRALLLKQGGLTSERVFHDNVRAMMNEYISQDEDADNASYLEIFSQGAIVPLSQSISNLAVSLHTADNGSKELRSQIADLRKRLDIFEQLQYLLSHDEDSRDNERGEHQGEDPLPSENP